MLGIGFFWMLNRARRAAPHARNKNARSFPIALQLIEVNELHGLGHKHDAPDVCQDRGRDAETDDVGERIEFAAEFAGRVRHARDAAIETVEDHRESDRLRRDLEILLRKRGLRREMTARPESYRTIER